MAQRVFLVDMPVQDLNRVATALVEGPATRRHLAEDLVEAARPHLLRATVSERVAIAAEKENRGQGSIWGFGRSCLPYLMAAEGADEIIEELGALSVIEVEASLEEYFSEQVELFGLEPGAPDRDRFKPPEPGPLKDAVESLLHRMADLRAAASTDESALPNYAISTWVWLARIFVRLRPTFWEGRNRWLGNAAFPQSQNVTPQVLSFGGSGEVSGDLQALILGSIDATRSQMASSPVTGLAERLVSTADLVPAFGMHAAREHLSAGGDAYVASGAVPFEQLGPLQSIMDALRVSDSKPYPEGADWIELVDAAARWAERNGSHLVEADDAFPGAYRWPLDQID